MSRFHYIILILAYICGLLLTGFWGVPNPHPSWQQWGIICLIIIVVPPSLFFWLQYRWRRCPKLQFWWLVSLVALMGVVYFQWRIPAPTSTDISQFIKEDFSSQRVEVLGKLSSEPRITNNERKRFWLQAQKINFLSNNNQFQSVTGKLYVTLPIDEISSIYPGQTLIIKGNLYKPRSPLNPGAFDFKKYLAKQGAFSGLKGEKIIFKGEYNNWGWLKLKQRIIKGFTNGLGEENGLVISSMILGRNAVDLPPDIRDLFINIGLAHILAASGFHVALLLGIILWLTQSLSPIKKSIIGIIILILYVGLTGIQPSILRASLMGITILLAQVIERKPDSLGTLLWSGFLLLIGHPLWIWDLGFQLSFLATFALLVTSPSIQKKLDFLPPKISSMIAVPVAVSIWTSPLIMYVFYSFSFYIIPFNILVTPLIMFLVIGGIISAVLILINPSFGGFIAQILFWPIQILLESGKQITQLKLTAVAVGKISLIILIIIYGILGMIWLNEKWGKRWHLGGIIIILLIIIPILYKNLTLFQMTILPTNNDPMIVIQDRGKAIVINLSNESDIKYTLIPFLSQQGINLINAIIIPYPQDINPWLNLKKNLKVKKIFSLVDDHTVRDQSVDVQETISLNSMTIKLLNRQPFMLQWKGKEQSWLWIDSQEAYNNLSPQNFDESFDFILFSGKKVSLNLLHFFKTMNPKSVIISTPFLSSFMEQELIKQNIQFYWMQKDGAIQWTPKTEIKPLFRNQEQDT
jgi:competence protein ComEC